MFRIPLRSSLVWIMLLYLNGLSVVRRKCLFMRLDGLHGFFGYRLSCMRGLRNDFTYKLQCCKLLSTHGLFSCLRLWCCNIDKPHIHVVIYEPWGPSSPPSEHFSALSKSWTFIEFWGEHRFSMTVRQPFRVHFEWIYGWNTQSVVLIGLITIH